MSSKTRKALFQTPGSVIEEQVLTFNQIGGTLLNNNAKQLDIVDKTLAKSVLNLQQDFQSSKQDTHKERMTHLKLLLNDIEEDNWKYDSVEKLIGI